MSDAGRPGDGPGDGEPSGHEGPPGGEPSGYEGPPGGEPSGYEGPPGGEAPGYEEVPRPPDSARLTDPNLAAVERAGLPADLAEWLREVAAQVDPRLDRVAPEWRHRDQAEAARACVFGLLLGYLGRTYPHVRGELSQVAEAHPSFSTLETGSRLVTLEQIVADPGRVTAWLGPLVDVEDPERMRPIIE